MPAKPIHKGTKGPEGSFLIADETVPTSGRRSRLRCLCTACGGTTTVYCNDFKRGHTRSCGCIAAKRATEYMAEKYPVGSRWNYLEVQSLVALKGKRHAICTCVACGKREVVVKCSHLGRNMSCGCMAGELLRAANTGEKNPNYSGLGDRTLMDLTRNERSGMSREEQEAYLTEIREALGKDFLEILLEEETT